MLVTKMMKYRWNYYLAGIICCCSLWFEKSDVNIGTQSLESIDKYIGGIFYGYYEFISRNSPAE